MIDTEFASNTSWRFVRADYVFPVPTNPWFEEFPEVYNVNDLAASIMDADFVGVKIGDVNASADANFTGTEDRTIEGVFAFEVADQQLKAGSTYTATFTASELAKIRGYQGTLTFNTSVVELVSVEYGAAKEEHFGMRFAAQGAITTSWNGEAAADDVLFSLVLRAKTDGQLSEVLGVSSGHTVAEAYSRTNQLWDLAIHYNSGVLSSGSIVLEQNTPNPFGEQTKIGFSLPQACDKVKLTITDVQGRVVKTVEGSYEAGRHELILLAKDLPKGVLLYTLEAGAFTASRRMVIQE